MSLAGWDGGRKTEDVNLVDSESGALGSAGTVKLREPQLLLPDILVWKESLTASGRRLCVGDGGASKHA